MIRKNVTFRGDAEQPIPSPNPMRRNRKQATPRRAPTNSWRKPGELESYNPQAPMTRGFHEPSLRGQKSPIRRIASRAGDQALPDMYRFTPASTSSPTKAGPFNWSHPLTRERPTYAQVAASTAQQSVGSLYVSWVNKQIANFMDTLPDTIKPYMMSSDKYKTQLDAIDHSHQIRRILDFLHTKTLKTPRTNIHCFYCKKPDHLIKSCPALRAEVYRKNFPCRKCLPKPKKEQGKNLVKPSIHLSETKTSGGTIFEIFQADKNQTLPKETFV